MGYVIFLVWAQTTAPVGTKRVAAVGEPMELAATLMMAFSIHGFLVSNILRNPDREQYNRIVGKTFFIGTLIYIFIAYGSFGTSALTKP